MNSPDRQFPGGFIFIAKGKELKKYLYIFFCISVVCCREAAVAASDADLRNWITKIGNMRHTGMLFKHAEIEIVVGKQYKMSDLIRSDFAAAHPVSASHYSGPARGALLATPSCYLTYSYLSGGYSGIQVITPNNGWGGSVGQGLDPGELESSWIRFDSEDCTGGIAPCFYSDGEGWADIIRIKLLPATIRDQMDGNVGVTVSQQSVAGAKSKCSDLAKKTSALKIALGVSVAGGAISTIAGGVAIAGQAIESKREKDAALAANAAAAEAAKAEEATGAAGTDAVPKPGVVGSALTSNAAGWATGIGAAAGGAAATVSASVGLAKLAELEKALKECQSAVNEIN